MLAFKMMAIFAVAYAQMASGDPAPEENIIEAFKLNVGVEMVRASSSGRHEEIPNEMGNSGSDESKPQESANVKTTASEFSSPTQETSTEAGTTPTTTEAEGSLPAVCPAEYEAFWVSDYSEAEKRFLARFYESNVEDCCQKLRQDYLERWMERSFSIEDGVCTLYTYAPVNRSDMSPLPNEDGSDKILYVKQTPTDLCTHEYGNDTIQWPDYTSVYIPSIKTTDYCARINCVGGEIEVFNYYNIRYGNDKCLSFATGLTLEDAAQTYDRNGFAMFNIFSESDEQLFLDYDWDQLLNEYRWSSILVDVVYDSAVDEYRWRQSLRPIPDNSPLWAPGYPTTSRFTCVAVNINGLVDQYCPSPGHTSRYLATREQSSYSI